MDVITATRCDDLREAFKQIISYSSSNSLLADITGMQMVGKNNVTDNKVSSDALQAVKLDPAVLEARVTYNTQEDLDKGVNSPLNYARASDKAIVGSKGRATRSSFEEMIWGLQTALLSLPPSQLDLLMSYASTLRRQRLTNQMNLECAFCKNNGESVCWYSSHALRNWRGSVQCPVLRALRCPRCGATGDRAHTIKYCSETDNDFLTRPRF